MTLNEIEILGTIILEPIGSLTDVITGFVSLVLAFMLWKKRSHIKSMQLFTYYFLFTGLATICGGIIGHALLHYISPQWKMMGWSLSAIGLFFFERGSFEYFSKQLGTRLLNSLNTIITLQLIVFFLLLLLPATRSFKVVQVNATFSYIGIILPFYLYAIYYWKNRTAWLIIAGIVIASIAGLVYNMEITIHQWFNHHVLTHVVMTLYVVFMYYAVTKLHSTFVFRQK